MKCHPRRPRLALGLCRACYQRQWFAAHPDFERGRGRTVRATTCHPDRKHFAKGMCKQCYNRAYGQTDKCRSQRKEHWERRGRLNKQLAKCAAGLSARRARRYRLTLEQQVRLARAKACDLCGRKFRRGERTCIDHDHRTRAVRGLLCQPCNVGLGALGDTTAGLERALEYLRRTASS